MNNIYEIDEKITNTCICKLCNTELDISHFINSNCNKCRDLIDSRRETVLQSYKSSIADNKLLFMEGDVKATEEYIFPNQMEDAKNIVNIFKNNNRRVISIQKKTKVGADGLMIEIAKLLSTDEDYDFIINYNNIRIITGMSNAGWEKDMIDKAPSCFKKKIFHHGKLSKSDLISIRNGLIIIDEIDTGDKERQVLHNTLNEAGILDIEHMKNNNNRFVFISATMIKELYELYKWGDLHELYKMTIPTSYFGHRDFLNKGIIKEFFSLASKEAADKWIKEDIIYNYNNDYRVHIVRVNPKTVNIIQNACIINGIIFRNHTSTDRLTDGEINEFFNEPLKYHIVLAVKGFFRRANLIPNKWKQRIGATHELYTKKVDNNVQVQGLPGRMSGYWRNIIEAGHKTGPHRCSIKAIEEYEKSYEDPFGLNTYNTSGFKKRNGIVTSESIMLSPSNISNLIPNDLPVTENRYNPKTIPIIVEITKEDIKKIDDMGRNKKQKIEYIKTIINNDELISIMNTYEIIQITKPSTEKSYKKHIIDVVNAAVLKNKFKIDINDNNENKNCYNIYIDSKENRLCFVIWKGLQ
jgi:hypothetical protein